MGAGKWREVMAAGVVGAACCGEGVGAPPDYGFDWVTIGAPGNRAANQEEAPDFYPYLEVGGVAHEYRMTETEVTVSQWFEYVQAYAPYWEGSPTDPHFTSRWVFWTPTTGHFIQPGMENVPANMSWRHAARFCNWLHNGKRTDRDAFENGVYDTSTFGENDDGTHTDQVSHNPDALFWVPTLDEWTKGMYYDPDRYGAGQEGYWLYPHSSNEPPIPGYPEDGGQTSAGIPFDSQDYLFLDVGSYPDVRSPWGLLDGSGGESEWTETMLVGQDGRFAKGTRQFFSFPEVFDRLDYAFAHGHAGLTGLRLSSRIPGPSGVTVFWVASCALLWRRR